MVHKSTVIIDTYYHTKTGEKFAPIEYIEHFVRLDGEIEYQRKSTPKKWHNSREPLRMFELWLLNDKRCNRRNAPHCVDNFLNYWNN